MIKQVNLGDRLSSGGGRRPRRVLLLVGAGVLAAIVVALGLALRDTGNGNDVVAADGAPSAGFATGATSPLPAEADDAPVSSAESVDVLPILVGRTLTDLGDTGELFALHQVIGVQRTEFVASEEAPAGTVIEQTPEPGTPVGEIAAWTLVVSDGGPVASLADVPPSLAATVLERFDLDPDTPLLMVETDFGVAYKSDAVFFSEVCAAVDNSTRPSLDGEYDRFCPG